MVRFYRKTWPGTKKQTLARLFFTVFLSKLDRDVFRSGGQGITQLAQAFLQVN